MKIISFTTFFTSVVNSAMGSGKDLMHHLRYGTHISRHLEECTDPCDENNKKVRVCHYSEEDGVFEELCIAKQGSVGHTNNHQDDYCGMCTDADVCGSWPCEDRGLCKTASSLCNHVTGDWSQCAYADVQCAEGLVCDDSTGDCVVDNCLHEDTNIMTLGIDWIQAPYSGEIIEESRGLKLKGSNYRVGNYVYSKDWYNLERASVYFKWQAGSQGYAGWGVGISGVKAGGSLTTQWTYSGSTLIPGNTDIFTKITCVVDVDPPKCESWSSAGNYIDQSGSILLRHETFDDLMNFQLDLLKRAQLYFGFHDNYAGINEHGTLFEVIVTGAAVEKPVTCVSLYNGEDVIPSSLFTWTSGSTTCVWNAISDDGVNAIKGSWSHGQTSACTLTYNLANYPVAKGVSFSMKTEVQGTLTYSRLGVTYTPITSNSGSGWKSYCVSIPTPSWQEVTWRLDPQLAYFVGNEQMYLKDIQLLVD